MCRIRQKYPKGLPDAFIIGKSFIGKSNIALILGDMAEDEANKYLDQLKLDNAELFDPYYI